MKKKLLVSLFLMSMSFFNVISNVDRINAEELGDNANIEHFSCYDKNMNPCDISFNLSKEDLTFYDDDDFLPSMSSLYPDMDLDSIIDTNNQYLMSGPIQKIVSVTKYYSYIQSAPNSIYYDQNGYFGYIPRVEYHRSPDYPFWIVTYGGVVTKKGPGVN